MADVKAARVLARGDARFVLPAMPSSAAVLGDLDRWTDALRAAGVPIVDPALGLRPDLAVCGAKDAELAAGIGAPMTLIEGRLRGSDRRQHALEISCLPSTSTPRFLAPRGALAALRYGLLALSGSSTRVRRSRNVAVARLVLPLQRFVPAVTVLADRPGPPAVVAGARDLGVGADWEWLLWMREDERQRGIVFALPPAAEVPAIVVKFSRLPGVSDATRRDVRGLELVAADGGAFAATAPRLHGTFTFHGHEASVEGALPGTPLGQVLSGASLDDRLPLLERVIDVLVRAARETRVPPEALDSERSRFVAEVLPEWPQAGRGWESALASVPGTFQHGDLWPQNTVTDGSRVGIVDWARAKRVGFPLGDVLFFAASGLIDGERDRERHLADLCGGAGPASSVLFRWIEEVCAAAGIGRDVVPALATASWLDLGSRNRRSREQRQLQEGSVIGPYFGERMATLWMADPRLGPAWPAWRARTSADER